MSDLKSELEREREQLATAVSELRADVSKLKTRVPLALGVLGALRIALKLRRRA